MSNSKIERRELKLVAEFAAAYVSNNPVPQSELQSLVQTIRRALTLTSDARAVTAPARAALKPAVTVAKSISDDFIVCLEDGAKLRMLKRYLRTHHRMTPDDYRRKWGLPSDYPMVAPSYARLRSEHAKKNGLGKVHHSNAKGAKRK